MVYESLVDITIAITSGVPGHRHLSGFRGCLRTHLQGSQVPWLMDFFPQSSDSLQAGLMLVAVLTLVYGRYNELDNHMVFMRFINQLFL